MLRADKVKVVEGMTERFSGTPHVFLATFSGLSANQATDLRRKVREAGGSFRVIKNRLAKRAAPGTGMEKIAEQLQGPCALAAHESDPVGLAKVLSDFAKGNPQLVLLAAVVDAQQVVDEGGVKQLASLPGLPELRAQLLSVILGPASALVRLLNTPGGQLARVIDARRESQGGGES